jgi:exodeoxyribonuclease VII small subunit
MSGQDKSIEEKTAELTRLISWFDSDEFAIEEALEKFNEAQKLAEAVEHDLMTLKNEIEIVKRKFDSE